jgi:hypothetical protein
MLWLAFDYRRRGGESGGRPRLVLPVKDQLADWQAAIDFAATLPGVDPTRIAGWGFSATGGHLFRVGARNPGLAAVIAHTPNADGLATTRNASGHQKPLAMLRFTAKAALDLLGGVVAVIRCWCRSAASRAPSRSSPPRTVSTPAGRSTPKTGTRTGNRWSPPGRPSASPSTGQAVTRLGCEARCSSWCAPGPDGARRAGRRRGGHYAPFLEANNQPARLAGIIREFAHASLIP